MPEILVSRDGFGSPVPRQPAHLHTQAESGAYLRDSSQVRMTTKETKNCCDFLCFGDIRRSHLDCISRPTLSHLGYISRHTAVTMGLCGFTQPSVLCMLSHRSGPAHQFRKNQFGGCGTDIYTYRYIYIYIIYIYVRFRLHTGCVVLSGKFTNRGLCCCQGWSRSYRSTQHSYWVA